MDHEHNEPSLAVDGGEWWSMVNGDRNADMMDTMGEYSIDPSFSCDSIYGDFLKWGSPKMDGF